MKKFLSVFVAASIVATPMDFTNCSAEEPIYSKVAEGTSRKDGYSEKVSKAASNVKKSIGKCGKALAENATTIAATTAAASTVGLVSWNGVNFYKNKSKIMEIAKDPALSIAAKTKAIARILFFGVKRTENVNNGENKGQTSDQTTDKNTTNSTQPNKNQAEKKKVTETTLNATASKDYTFGADANVTNKTVTSNLNETALNASTVDVNSNSTDVQADTQNATTVNATEEPNTGRQVVQLLNADEIDRQARNSEVSDGSFAGRCKSIANTAKKYGAAALSATKQTALDFYESKYFTPVVGTVCAVLAAFGLYRLACRFRNNRHENEAGKAAVVAGGAANQLNQKPGDDEAPAADLGAPDPEKVEADPANQEKPKIPLEIKEEEEVIELPPADDQANLDAQHEEDLIELGDAGPQNGHLAAQPVGLGDVPPVEVIPEMQPGAVLNAGAAGGQGDLPADEQAPNPAQELPEGALILDKNDAPRLADPLLSGPPSPSSSEDEPLLNKKKDAPKLRAKLAQESAAKASEDE